MTPIFLFINYIIRNRDYVSQYKAQETTQIYEKRTFVRTRINASLRASFYVILSSKKYISLLFPIWVSQTPLFYPTTIPIVSTYI